MNHMHTSLASLSPQQKRQLLEQRLRQKISASKALPLSFAQQRLWFLQQLEPELSAYNLLIAWRFHGMLSVNALEQSLHAITQRHEALRSTFQAVDGQPFQIVSPDVTLKLPVINLRDLPEIKREAEVQRQALSVSQEPFDLAQGPLWRATLLHLDDKNYTLLLTIHHIIFDGWSVEVLWRELASFYSAFYSAQPASLPDLPIQYIDYAVWQRQRFESDVLKQQLAYWQQQLHGPLPVLELPADRPRPSVLTSQGERQSRVFSAALTSGLKTLSQQQGTTLFMTLFAAFLTLLYRYTGQTDLLVGTPVAGRTRIETEDLIGFFVNTLVLRANLAENPRFQALLGHVRNVVLEMYAHQEVPFEKLVETLGLERDLSRNPLFEVMFVFQNTPLSTRKLSDLTVSPMMVNRTTAMFDLTLFMQETEQGLRAVCEYRTDLYDADRIIRMLDHLQILLEGIVANPAYRLSEMPLLTEAEHQLLLVAWNATVEDYPHGPCIHHLFEAQVAKTPDAVAVQDDNHSLTYSELNRRSNQLAHYLRTLGVGPEVRVGLYMHPSLEMIIGLLGVLKAGGAFVPLDPVTPQERLMFILADARVTVLISQEHLATSLPANQLKAVYLDVDWHVIAKQSNRNPFSQTTADNLASVLYTSGSTGWPKGVLGSHRATLNVLAWLWQTFPFTSGEVCCQKTSWSFVDAIQELMAPLLQGIPTILIANVVLHDLNRFIQTLANHHVTRLLLVPSLLRALLDTVIDLERQLPHLKLWFVSGERLSRELWQRFRDCMPNCRLINLYGASEDAADVTWFDTSLIRQEFVRVPIGRPIANTQAYILDRHLHPVPIGIPGELYIGGVGLARGYHHRSELTAATFIPHLFSDEPASVVHDLAISV